MLSNSRMPAAPEFPNQFCCCRCRFSQTQATIESLEKATIAQPRHPLRMAFGDNYLPMYRAKLCMQQGNYKYVQCALEHFCKMRLFAAPEFLRRMVADGVKNNMPVGLIVHKLNLRAGTLAAVATGSDMITITLPDLVCQLLGPNASISVKDAMKDIFGKAEAMGSKEILDELDAYIGQMSVFTQQDSIAKQSVVRLKERMVDILTGSLPECPITMEPIKKEDIRILPCCTAIIDKNVIDQCKGRCPLCRAAIGSVCFVAEEDSKKKFDLIDSVSPDNADNPDSTQGPELPSNEGGGGKRPIQLAFSKAKPGTSGRGSPSLKKHKRSSAGGAGGSNDPIAPDSDDEFQDSDDEEEDEDEDAPAVARMPEQPERQQQEFFEQKISAISAQRPYSVDGIVAVLNAQVEMNPSSRVLLCFGFDSNQRSIVRRIIDRIRAELANSTVTDIDACSKDYQKMEVAKMKFDDTFRYPGPQIFILNTTDRRSSVQGLDLHMTDLTIVADQCSLPAQRQAAGRSLRMKKRPREMSALERFPAKRLVVATIQGLS